jgi:hypothetical protein
MFRPFRPSLENLEKREVFSAGPLAALQPPVSHPPGVYVEEISLKATIGAASPRAMVIMPDVDIYTPAGYMFNRNYQVVFEPNDEPLGIADSNQPASQPTAITGTYDPSTGVLTAVSQSLPTAAADFNNDNDVDGADFLAASTPNAKPNGFIDAEPLPSQVQDGSHAAAVDEIFRQLGAQSLLLGQVDAEPQAVPIMMEWGSSRGLLSQFNQAENLVAPSGTEGVLEAASLDLTTATHDLQILHDGDNPDIYLSGGFRDAPKPNGPGGPWILANKKKDAENIEFKNESLATSSSGSGDQVLDLATGEVYEFPPGTLGEPAPPENTDPPNGGGGFWGKIFGGGGGGGGGDKKDKKDKK